MYLNTVRFGEIEYSADEIITFDKGIPGFDNLKQYIIFPLDEEKKDIFFYLQSIEDVGVGFYLVNPFEFFNDYDFELQSSTLQDLEIEKVDVVKVFTILSTNKTLQEATTNLKAPIILNVENKKAKQIILNEQHYSIKHPLFPSRVMPVQEERAK